MSRPLNYISSFRIKYMMDDRIAVTGIVIIHAHNRLMVTPQCTAVARFITPAPIMAPVMVCVVLTGMPHMLVTNKVNAPAVSALKPSNGTRCVIRCPMVFTIRQPPEIVPMAIAVWQHNTTHNGIGSLAVR